jgi:hypothetical protein
VIEPESVQRRQPRPGEGHAEGSAKDGGPPLRPAAGPHAPGDPHRPQAVGKVVYRGQNADCIDEPNQRALLHGFDACCDGAPGIEKPASQLSRHVFHPPRRVIDPAAGLKDVPKDECKGDHSGPSLERVTEILAIRIAGQVPFSARNDNRADDAVEQNWQKDACPLDHFQCSLAHAVDQIDTLLVAVVEDPHVGQEMDSQESAHRDQAGQRVQAADEEFMPSEN